MLKRTVLYGILFLCGSVLGKGNSFVIFDANSSSGKFACKLASGVTVSGMRIDEKRGFEKSGAMDISAQDKISLRFYAAEKTECSVLFKSGKGEFKKVFKSSTGEQIVILPKGVFERTQGCSGWSKIEKIEFKILKKGASLLLSGIAALPKSQVLPQKGLFLYKEITMTNPIGYAWPLYAIVDEEKYPKKGMENAGRTLQKYLEEMYGSKLPLNPRSFEMKKGASNIIFVGKKASLKSGAIDESTLKKQGFSGLVVRVKNGSLAIAGDSLQGTIYGVYRFLEKQGLKFYARGCFSKNPRIPGAIKAMEFEDKPFFEGKRCSAPFCIYGDSSSGFSLGDPRIAGIDEKYLCDRSLWIDHTAAFLVPKKLYMKEHPEYYILRGDGKRLKSDTPDVRLMLCQTNPGGIKVAAERALKWIEKQKDRKYFVIQQGDDMEACMCETCKAMRKKGFNESDLMLYWVNSIAKEIAKKYPDKRLLCYAYVSTQPPPNKLKLEYNVQLLYCPWPTKISAPNGFRDFDAPENVIAHDEIIGWIKQCGPENLGIYDYNAMVVLSLKGMADRVKWCARNGMKGGFWYCGQNQTFHDLFAYVHSQLNWDPFQDTSKLMRDFIRNYYGKAAPAMMEIIFGIYNRLDSDDKNNGRIPAREFFDKNFVEKTLALFAKAIKLAPEKIKPGIEKDEMNFLINGIYSLKIAGREDIPKEELESFGLLLSKYIKLALAEHNAAVECAKKRGKTPPGFGKIINCVWKLANVKIDSENLKDGEIPPRLLELQKNPVETIRKYRVTDFTKKLPNGIKLPAMAFSGAVGPMYYEWKCEGKVAAWVRGSMTDVSVMSAKFRLEKAPEGAAILTIEGQDSDKLWCPPVPIQILLNGNPIFEGPNGFVKHGWSKREFKIPAGLLRKGGNELEIRNLTNSDSRVAHWFMLSYAEITWGDK